MIGVGTDIVSIARMAQAIETGGRVFLDRVFAPSEQHAAEAHARPIAHYAKCFAAKEAVFKTLDTGWDGGLELREIEVRERAGGQPYVVLRGHASRIATEAGATQVLLSISYDGDYAVAVATLS